MFFGFMLGAMAMLAVSHDPAPQAYETVAVNYALYRNAAFLYAYSSKKPGTIADSALKLPAGWVRLRAWQARVQDSRCYVFGPATTGEIAAVRDLFQGSIAVGRAQGGRILPQPHAPVPVPAFVPEGSLISVIEVK